MIIIKKADNTHTHTKKTKPPSEQQKFLICLSCVVKKLLCRHHSQTISFYPFLQTFIQAQYLPISRVLNESTPLFMKIKKNKESRSAKGCHVYISHHDFYYKYEGTIRK